MPVTNWYVVFTRPGWEKKVVDSLTRKGIECYCPQKKITGTLVNRKKVEKNPLFTSYVFVRVNSLQLNDVRKVEGVMNLMYWLDKLAVVRDIEIEMMRRFLKEHDSVQVEKTMININDIVKIRTASQDVDGNSYGMKAKKIQLTLPSLGYSLLAEVVIDEREVVIKDDSMHTGASPFQNTLNYSM